MSPPFEHYKIIYSEPLDLQDFTSDASKWLVAQPPVGDSAWLLAYADDGVIWGEVKAGKLIQAYEIFGESFPKLEAETLQHAHLFGSLGEIRIFRQAGKLKAVRLEEEEDEECDAFTRSYILWGDKQKNEKDGWSWVEDGQLGIHQALPLSYPVGKRGRIFRLEVRYYLQYEPDHGQASVGASRLLALKSAGGE